MKKPIASLSLDFDNKWAYMRTHGVAGWEAYPSYLDVVVPRVLHFCAQHEVQATCFIVGRDAERRENFEPLAALAADGHEIANHSMNHYPWMHTLPREQAESEICQAEEHIEQATGQQPIGFRGPGYSLSHELLEILATRGYLYDATTLPTYIGPLRWYFRRTATADAAEQAERREILGAFRDGFRPIRSYLWKTAAGPLVEIPVTTFPIARLPIHVTYLLYLWQFSPRLTKAYLQMALSACRWMGIGPSVLMHPLDFLGVEDEPDLRFFPGMNLPQSQKLELLNGMLAGLNSRFELVSMQTHAEETRHRFGLPAWQRPAPEIASEQMVAEPSESRTAQLSA